MAKKSDPKPKLTVWQSNATVCQCCQFHSNNPSTCTSTELYVPRKAEGCEIFERRK